MKYEIFDYEIHSKKTVEAPGVVEAMFEYLPWPKLHLEINYKPESVTAEVIDNDTDFLYRVRWGSKKRNT